MRETLMGDLEKILKYTKNIHMQALTANSYLFLLKYFNENYKSYIDEINSTPAFWAMTYNSWYDSCFMLLARIFDVSSNVVGIRQLREIVGNNASLLGTEKISFPMREIDEKIFGKEVEVQDALFDILGVEGKRRKYYFDATGVEMVEIFSKKFTSMSKILDRLRNQRNKIVAHNSGEVEFDENKLKHIKRISLYDEDLLITYALDFTQFIIYAIKNEYLPIKYGNIEDIDFVVQFIHDGYERMKERDKAISEKM